jgi:hypothetical protein
VPEDVSVRLKEVRLWWVLEIVARSTVAAEILSDLRSAASEESRVSSAMKLLCSNVASLELKFSSARVHACSSFQNLAELLVAVRANLARLIVRSDPEHTLDGARMHPRQHNHIIFLPCPSP